MQTKAEYDARKALVKSYLGKTVRIEIDRPIGTVHEKNGHTWCYPINYGFIPGVLGGDGEELDVYLLGVREPIRSLDKVRIVAIIHREDDIEDKLVGIPQGEKIPTESEIASEVFFQERYHKSHIELTESPPGKLSSGESS